MPCQMFSLRLPGRVEPKRTLCRALQANNTSTTESFKAKAPASPVFATVCLSAPLRYQTLWNLQAWHLLLLLPGSEAHCNHQTQDSSVTHFTTAGKTLGAFRCAVCFIIRANLPGEHGQCKTLAILVPCSLVSLHIKHRVAF